MARARDIAPGRILPDTAIVEPALGGPATVEALAEISVFGGRSTRRSLGTWFAAIEAARALPDNQLPPTQLAAVGPPPARSWPEKDPAAAARLAAARTAITALADRHQLPVENLLAPDTLRRLAWTPPEPATTDSVAAALAALGARDWQVELTTEPIALALTAPPADSDEKSD
jgi:ribonuclease D